MQIGDFLEFWTIGVQTVSLKLVSQNQFPDQGKAAHYERRISRCESGYVPGVVLRKEHVVNSCMGHGMADGKTCVRFENDTRNKEWRAMDDRRHDKAGNLVRLVATILAAPDGEKRPRHALGEEIPAAYNAYRKKRQGGGDFLEAHIQCLT